MVGMQIQVPDELYAKARAVADYREWTLAETIRRSLEVFVQMTPRTDTPKGKWRLPVVDVGSKQLGDEELSRIIAHYGVKRLATRNVKHFQGYGFEKVYDPTT